MWAAPRMHAPNSMMMTTMRMTRTTSKLRVSVSGF
jgi:hypothetical protein